MMMMTAFLMISLCLKIKVFVNVIQLSEGSFSTLVTELFIQKCQCIFSFLVCN